MNEQKLFKHFLDTPCLVIDTNILAELRWIFTIYSCNISNRNNLLVSDD